ncbi:MAG: CCA tRNA nucleotidyltransferase [Lachnospiraceae bacterium]|nr:CCA tRNA nucleotidyltransferase [Lachnospiraceae bacterium]
MIIELPKEVRNIIEILQRHGHEAYAVGGAVRDAILGHIPKDWDITSDATPQEIKSIFNKTVDTGLQHGTVTVIMGGVGYEVTTYRIDGKYSDARHPEDVTFTRSLTEDLKRRDFTINAMAYNDEAGLVDEFGGRKDLENGIIRTVGNPKERFSEDALRMLRALRFSAQLGFEVDKDTSDAIIKLSPTITKISAERIREELLKLIESDNPGHITKMYDLGLTKYILPEFDKIMACEQYSLHHMYSVGMHTVVAMENVPPKRVFRLTMLLHDMGKPDTKSVGEDGYNHFFNHTEVGAQIANDVLSRLKFDNDTRKKVVRLVRYHDERPKLTKKSVRKRIVKIGEEAFPDLFTVNRADILAQSMYQREEKLEYVDRFEEMYNQIMSTEHCLKISELKITGKDLIEMGVKQGPDIGRILGQLLDEVIDEPEKNDKTYLVKRTEELMD